MIAMGSYKKYEIGDIGKGLLHEGIWHKDQPFKVLSRITSEEYIEWVRTNLGELNIADWNNINRPNATFYMISVD